VHSNPAQEGLLLYVRFRYLESDRPFRFVFADRFSSRPMLSPTSEIARYLNAFTISPYDAPILHEDLQLPLQAKIIF
jgi:hypothetical protein